MKKHIPMAILAALLLSGCGLREQALEVSKTYIAPAVESAVNQTGGAAAEPDSGPSVHTDKSALTDYVLAERIFTRLSDAPLTALAPSDTYGVLLPYAGAFYYDADGNRQEKFGLTTKSGTIVLDPVLTGAGLACYDSGSGCTLLDIYILSRYVENEDGSGQTKYAVAGKDGSWTTGFDYTQVLAMEPGVLCVRDAETNDAVCYDETGAVVFDTSGFSWRSQLQAGSVGSFAEYSEGYMRIRYSNGQFGFTDKSGNILNKYNNMPSYFDDVHSFSENYAAVALYGKWNYIDTDGSYAIYGLFDEAGDFKNGVAVVKKDGVYSAIDPENNVLRDFADAEIAKSSGRYIYVKNTDGTEHYYLTPSLEEANLYDKALHMSSEGYWVVGANGVRLRLFSGGEVYFSGATALETCSGDGLYLAALADGSLAVMDAYSRVVVTGGADIGFVKDSETGETYVFSYGSDGGVKLYSADGALAAEGVLLRGAGSGFPQDANGEGNPCADFYYGPDGGLVMCADAFTSGLKNMSNNWVFRVTADMGD